MILSFKETFVPAVVAGTKPHTIRVGQRWRVGMSIQFYQGSYHQKRYKFRPDAVVTAVQTVRAWEDRAGWHFEIDGRLLSDQDLEQFAEKDGFKGGDYPRLFAFLEVHHGLPFIGQLIHWTDLRY